ncbi:MAG: PIN domain-containing protein [Clostridiales Family XIII bacterium]|jgi:predicted nucleic acid-binding protein|nr:PIN domain-containing protein [Clostridiales Family XIII bacterium]
MRLYLETTMFNYFFDAERDGHADTVRLFEDIRNGKHEAFTSEYVEIELRKASEPKRSNMLALIQEYGIKVFGIDEDSDRLADIYTAHGIIPERFRFDSLHIAIASVHGLDYVLSYNFQHINRAKTKLFAGRINSENGYETVVICTAKEVLEDEYNDEE